MKVLIVGGGGREHTIATKIAENPSVTKLYAAPGNGGMADICELVPLKATDITGITAFCKENQMDYVVVAPDDPLCLGLVDLLAEAGIPAFGPEKKAAIIEGSKVFSKNLMKKYNIPTAAYEACDEYDEAVAYLNSLPEAPLVVKADGLALGKGVLICQNKAEALDAVSTMMKHNAFGASGHRVVIEEFLTGPEVSVLAFTDGKVVKPMVSSMDHKRALDHDEGLNTGGMGTIAPNPCYTPEMAQICMETIFLPTIRAMEAEGCPFKGCLYFGLMLTPTGPKVIEYNCRFGDPETQVVLPLLKTDLLTVMEAVENERLHELDVQWLDASAACVILASGGYPGHYEKGNAMSFPDTFPQNITCYHAGSKMVDGQLFTNGGRVLGITAVAPTLTEALQDAYATAQTIHFDGKYMRRDIGQRALKAMEEK